MGAPKYVTTRLYKAKYEDKWHIVHSGVFKDGKGDALLKYFLSYYCSQDEEGEPKEWPVDVKKGGSEIIYAQVDPKEATAHRGKIELGSVCKECLKKEAEYKARQKEKRKEQE